MTKRSAEDAEDTKTADAIDVDSGEREGNDIPSLIGSGAPMVKIRAKTNIQGLRVGQVGTFVQTEEIRLQVQNGLAEVVND